MKLELTSTELSRIEYALFEVCKSKIKHINELEQAKKPCFKNSLHRYEELRQKINEAIWE